MINPMNMMGARKGGVYTPPVSNIDLWHFDDSLVGEEGGTWAGTGNSYVTGKFDNALKGTVNNGMVVDVDIDIHTGPKTIECFAKIEIAWTNLRTFFTGWTGTGQSGDNSFYFATAANETMYAVFFGANHGGTLTITANSALTLLNTFRHWALVFDETETRIYFDGSLAQTIAEGSDDFTSAIKSLAFGRASDCDPVIDEIRISNSAVYSGPSFTVPTAPFS